MPVTLYGCGVVGAAGATASPAGGCYYAVRGHHSFYYCFFSCYYFYCYYYFCYCYCICYCVYSCCCFYFLPLRPARLPVSLAMLPLQHVRH